jgi:hypothetical protein
MSVRFILNLTVHLSTIMASVTLSMGLRQKVQVSMTPAKTLAQALAEFCVKFDLDASEHALTHNKKAVDLALSWRLSGISANATLEVKKAATSSKVGTDPMEFDVESELPHRLFSTLRCVHLHPLFVIDIVIVTDNLFSIVIS